MLRLDNYIIEKLEQRLLFDKTRYVKIGELTWDLHNPTLPSGTFTSDGWACAVIDDHIVFFSLNLNLIFFLYIKFIRDIKTLKWGVIEYEEEYKSMDQMYNDIKKDFISYGVDRYYVPRVDVTAPKQVLDILNKYIKYN